MRSVVCAPYPSNDATTERLELSVQEFITMSHPASHLLNSKISIIFPAVCLTRKFSIFTVSSCRKRVGKKGGGALTITYYIDLTEVNSYGRCTSVYCIICFRKCIKFKRKNSILIIMHSSLYPRQLCDKIVVTQNVNSTSKTKQGQRTTHIS
jgi:hypothetical protein